MANAWTILTISRVSPGRQAALSRVKKCEKNRWFSDCTGSCWKIKASPPTESSRSANPCSSVRVSLQGEDPQGRRIFLNHWSNHDVGNRCRYHRQNVILQQPREQDEVKEKLRFQAEGEARRLEEKWRQNTALANELSRASCVNSCQTQLKKISILSCNRSKQTIAWNLFSG